MHRNAGNMDFEKFLRFFSISRKFSLQSHKPNISLSPNELLAHVDQATWSHVPKTKQIPLSYIFETRKEMGNWQTI